MRLIKSKSMLGNIIDGVEWVTGGHWGYQAKYVVMPEHGIREFAKGNSWSVGARIPVTDKTLRSVLKAPKGERPGRFTDLIHSEITKAKAHEWAARIVVSEDEKLYTTIRTMFLIDAVPCWEIRLSGLYTRVSFWVPEKEVGGKKVPAELMAMVMPMRIDTLNDELTAVAKLVAKVQAAEKKALKAKKKPEAKAGQ